MTKLVHVAGAACAMSLVVSLASAQSLSPMAVGRDGPASFVGLACIISGSVPQCANNGFTIGECGPARYMPREIPGNPNSTGLSILWPDYGMNFFLSQGTLVGTAFRTVSVTTIGAGVPWNYPAQARIVAQTPANAAASQTAVVTMDVNGFQNQCNVRLRFTGQRRP